MAKIFDKIFVSGGKREASVIKVFRIKPLSELYHINWICINYTKLYHKIGVCMCVCVFSISRRSSDPTTQWLMWWTTQPLLIFEVLNLFWSKKNSDSRFIFSKLAYDQAIDIHSLISCMELIFQIDVCNSKT